MARAIASLFLATTFFVVPAATFAQQPNASDPTVLQLAARASSKLTNGTPVTDVSINATVSYFAGPDRETGTAKFIGSGTQQSKVALQLQSGQRIEVRGITI
jgi:hypothetical protein